MVKDMQVLVFFLRFVWPHLICILMLFSRILTLSWFLFVCLYVCVIKIKKIFDSENVKPKVKLPGFRISILILYKFIEMYTFWICPTTYLNDYINLSV